MKGNLLIAGGNIHTREVCESFVKLAGGAGARIGVIPAATSEVYRAITDCTDMLKQNGIQARNIVIIKISCEESLNWARNGDLLEALEEIDTLDAVWFTGGDQIRLANAFLHDDGTSTKALEKLYALLERGGTIGGSSAGAAIMSIDMIARGTSKGAYLNPVCECKGSLVPQDDKGDNEALYITKGLGFFKDGMIDQHFDKRERLGRLVKAMACRKVNKGYGIAEDTAIACNLSSRTAKVIGTGKVVIINGNFNDAHALSSCEELLEHVRIQQLEKGDVFSFPIESQPKGDSRDKTNSLSA
jgi:cyanophycinase